MSVKKIFEVALVLSATDKATRVINDLTVNAQRRIGNMSKLGDKAFSFGRQSGVFGGGIIAGLGLTVKAAEDSEIANKRLESTFRTMGETNNKAAEEAENYADKLQMQIGVEDEEIKMVQSKLATFKKVSDEGARASGVFNRATAAAYDLQAAGFGEASQNAVLLGKALQDPTRGATALARTGALNKSDVPLIKQIQATKGLAAAQEYVLNRVEKQVKGQAVNTATSANKMKVTFAEIAETLGKTLLPQVQKTMKQIGDAANRFNKWASDNPKLLGTITGLIGKVGLFSLAVSGLSFAFGGVFKAIAGVMWLMNGYKQLMLIMKAAQMAYTFTLLSTGSGFQAVSAGLKAMNLGFLTSPIFWIGALLVGVVVLIWKYWGPIKEFFGKLWDGIKIVFWKVVDWFKEWGILLLGPIGFVIKFWTPIKGFFGKLWDGVKSVFSKFWAFVKEWGVLLLGPVGFIIKYWDKLPGLFGMIWDRVKNIFGRFWDYIKQLPSKFFALGGNIITGIWEGLKSKALALFNYVKDLGNKIAKTFKSVLGIASPSKVFMDYGVNIAEGASKGIQKGSSGAVASSKGMAKGLSPASSGGRGGNMGGLTVHFSPVVSGGGSGGDVAAEIKKLLPDLIRQIEAAWARKARLAY